MNPNSLKGSTELRLSWTAPASNGGSPITGYRIERAATRSAASGSSTWPAPAAPPPPTQTPVSAPNTTRFYRVRALNAQGHGDPSNVAEGTTNAARPGQPQNLRARGGTDQHHPRLGRAVQRPAGSGSPATPSGRAAPATEPGSRSLQHGFDGDHLHGHGTPAGQLLPVPGGGDQPRGTRPVVVRGEHEHLRPASRRTDRADGPGDRHLAHRPVVDCAPQHRRRPHPRLPDRGLRRRGQTPGGSSAATPVRRGRRSPT